MLVQFLNNLELAILFMSNTVFLKIEFIRLRYSGFCSLFLQIAIRIFIERAENYILH